jgi:tetratricopeptide (TPR) repeat protein
MASSKIVESLVTVIVRTTGRPTLARSLRAIARQDYPNVETVVVDAANAGVLDTRDGRAVSVVGDGRQHGRADAANLGLVSAKGEYIVLLDDDDEFQPTHIRGLISALTNSEHMAAYSDAEAVDTNGRVTKVYEYDYSQTLLHTTNLFPCHAVLFARRLVEMGCRFDPSLPLLEDWEFWLQVAEHTWFVRVPRCTARYYIEAGSSGAGHGPNRNDAIVAVAARTIDARWHARRMALQGEHFNRRERAMELVRANRLTEAEPLLTSLVEIDPSDVDVLGLIGYCAFRGGRWDKAASALERAVALAPNRADLYYNLALAHERAGRSAAAHVALQNSLKSNPDFAPALAALARHKAM